MADHQRFGPYEPEELISSGRHAHVWLARGPDGEAAVLKIAREPADRAALAHEAAILAKVSGPGSRESRLVRLLDAADDGTWLVTERISGAPFDQWAAIQDFDEIVRAALQIVDALDTLHGRGIVHGDLKPSNVLVDKRGDVRVLDLGVATLLEEATAGFKGTLGYAAPELLRGERPDARCDLYSLGALLYTAVAQRPAFVATDPAALTYLPLVSLPPPPSAFRPDIPSALNQLLLGLLARSPDRRPQGLARVREALTRTNGSKPAPPVLGMLEERELLRQAVVGTADGEPRVVVLYGPPGSGRRTLIAEAVEYARREGLPYVKSNDVRVALQQIRDSAEPPVLVMRATNPGALKLAQVVLKDGLRCLLLLHSDRPVPLLAQRGAIHVTPAPLAQKDAARLARMWGADSEEADVWWRQSLGLPIALIGRIRAWRRERTSEEPHEVHLPPESRRILATLRERGEVEVAALAAELELGEHLLLDHCEVLFAEGLIAPASDGLAIQIAEGAA